MKYSIYPFRVLQKFLGLKQFEVIGGILASRLLILSPKNIGTQSVQELCFVFVIGAFVELFTVMIWLSFLVAIYSTKDTGNL